MKAYITQFSDDPKLLGNHVFWRKNYPLGKNLKKYELFFLTFIFRIASIYVYLNTKYLIIQHLIAVFCLIAAIRFQIYWPCLLFFIPVLVLLVFFRITPVQKYLKANFGEDCVKNLGWNGLIFQVARIIIEWLASGGSVAMSEVIRVKVNEYFNPDPHKVHGMYKKGSEEYKIRIDVLKIINPSFNESNCMNGISDEKFYHELDQVKLQALGTVMLKARLESEAALVALSHQLATLEETQALLNTIWEELKLKAENIKVLQESRRSIEKIEAQLEATKKAIHAEESKLNLLVRLKEAEEEVQNKLEVAIKKIPGTYESSKAEEDHLVATTSEIAQQKALDKAKASDLQTYDEEQKARAEQSQIASNMVAEEIARREVEGVRSDEIIKNILRHGTSIDKLLLVKNEDPARLERLQNQVNQDVIAEYRAVKQHEEFLRLGFFPSSFRKFVEKVEESKSLKQQEDVVGRDLFPSLTKINARVEDYEKEKLKAEQNKGDPKK